MEDLVLLTQAFLEVLGSGTGTVLHILIHLPLQEILSPSARLIKQGCYRPPRGVCGLGVERVRETLFEFLRDEYCWRLHLAKGLGPSPELSPGRGPMGPGRTPRLLDGAREVPNGIAQSKGKDDQMLGRLEPPY